IVVALTVTLPAQGTRTLRVASPVPGGTAWDNVLQQMRSDWVRGTQGRVRARIYPGQQQGDDASVLLKLQGGTMDAALLTAIGLPRIDPAFNVFAIPLFFDSYEELNHVMVKLTPMFRERLSAKVFVFLHWGHGGWIRVFSTRPAGSVADLKSLKMYTSAGDEEMIRIYQRHGFRPIALTSTAIMTGLSSGMIEAVPTTPTSMLLLQWFERVKYMLDIPLTPFLGAAVITTRAWNTISPADREVVLKAASAAEARLLRDIPKQDDESVQVMRGKGLTVVPAKGPEWRNEAQRFADDMKGMVPDAVYAAALSERDAFRARRPSAGH
ncbi:MAG TPA: TRAP transporter substrate-binding protein DctP, partial [Longimicrobiales bacterium]|nr:TRAP transporter substrate-binding protein DctP [Longimicrobiales bacterium]